MRAIQYTEPIPKHALHAFARAPYDGGSCLALLGCTKRTLPKRTYEIVWDALVAVHATARQSRGPARRLSGNLSTSLERRVLGSCVRLKVACSVGTIRAIGKRTPAGSSRLW